MDASDEFPPLALDCEVAAAFVTDRLELLGLQVQRSFDLRTAACVSHPEEACPHRGIAPCTCQLVVLLVYGPDGPPVSLVAHGYEQRTWFWLVRDPNQPAESSTQELVRLAFAELTLPAKSVRAASHAP
jgi:hypothetical protein